MTDEERKLINQLHERHGLLQRTLGELAGHMGSLAEAGICVPQERMDELMAAQKTMSDILGGLQNELEHIARQAGLPV